MSRGYLLISSNLFIVRGFARSRIALSQIIIEKCMAIAFSFNFMFHKNFPLSKKNPPQSKPVGGFNPLRLWEPHTLYKATRSVESP
jgi:hypothetical protein